MRKKGIYAILFVMLFVAVWGGSMKTYAAQPEAPYWHPDTLLNWSPDNDDVSEFNRGSVPLADRFKGEGVNSNASSKTKFNAVGAFNQHTSGTPSQGSDSFNLNDFDHWQYVEFIVAWAGSANEGIIVAPSADIIDSAHKNGVPVLGTIFFPPTVYGGKVSWVRDVIQKNSDGTFPVADKLIEASDYYGFDGWFINQETGGTNSADATRMQEFIQYIKEKRPNQHIQWYDAMINTGSVWWQNEFNNYNKMFLIDDNGNRVADSMFLNFNWGNGNQIINSYNNANAAGISPYDIYAASGSGAFNSTKIQKWWPSGNADPLTALAMFSNSNDRNFWISKSGDPTDTSQNSVNAWKGAAHYAIAQSPVNDLPFVTNFNKSNGHKYFVEGEMMRNKDWNNRSVQDILPTWRWIQKSSGTALKADFDYADAYNGGSSIKVTGDLNSANTTTIDLYKTRLDVSGDTNLAITYKCGYAESNMKVALTFTDAPDQYEYLSTSATNANEWNTESFSLSQYNGKTIAKIGLKFESSTDINNYSINIGKLAVYNSEASTLPAPSGLTVIDNDVTGTKSDVKLRWNKVDGAVMYEVYRVKPDGSREILGATPNTSYYVQPMDKIGSETETTIEVKAINESYVRGAASSESFEWTGGTTAQNVALNKTVTASSNVANEEPEKAVDGTTANNSKWCASGANGTPWLKIDLGQEYTLTKFVVKHAGAGGESTSYNTKDYKIQVSDNGTDWTDVVNRTGNTSNITTDNVSDTTTRYIRLYVTTPTQTTNNYARIYEVEAWTK